MQLTVLGCAGTFPGPSSPCSGYLVEHDGYRLILDLGAGALGNLQRHCDLREIDAVYITHLHADHCIDLVAYFYARRYHPQGMPPILPSDPRDPHDRLRAIVTANDSPVVKRFAAAILGLTHTDPAARWSLDRALASLDGPVADVAAVEPIGVDQLIEDGLAHIVSTMDLDAARLWPTEGFGAGTDACAVQYGAAAVSADHEILQCRHTAHSLQTGPGPHGEVPEVDQPGQSELALRPGEQRKADQARQLEGQRILADGCVDLEMTEREPLRARKSSWAD